MVSARSHRLAALLYDVGQLRAAIEDGEDSETERGEQSVEFLRELGDEDAALIVKAYHADGDHSTDPDIQRESQILEAASHLASPVAETEPSVETTRLSSVFTPLANHAAVASETHSLQPLSMDRDVLFPRPDSEHGTTIDEGYRRLWNGLTEAITEGAAYETVVHLMEKYTWCVPSDAGSPALPLYDRLRTTAAISEALHRADLGEDDIAALADGEEIDSDLFSLVKGDVSGIQSFLHRMRNPDEAQDRVSKRMRGRSTQLWLLNEGLSRLFLRCLDIPITNMIWSGGGQFYALVPTAVEDDLEAFETEVNQWLLDRFDGDLFFVVGRADARYADADSGFATLFRRVASDTDAGKLRKGESAIAALDTPVLGEAKEPCAACGGDKENDEDRCYECSVQEEIGRHLPQASHLRLDFSEREEAHFTLDLPGMKASWELVESEAANADRLYSLNSTAIPDSSGSNGFVFTGATVPTGGGVDRVWAFTEQASLARGDTEPLHVAKMDIDGLGNAIATVMNDGLSRLAALSRSLELFFSGYVNEIADQLAYLSVSESDTCDACQAALSETETREVEHRRNPDDSKGDRATYCRPDSETRSELHDSCVEAISPIYIGFSGGDDMLFVGPWDEAVTFGKTVRESFDEYSSGALTLSAGFFLTQPKYPIGRATESAEERLETAKEFSSGDRTKNAASLFGETLGWELDETAGMTALVDFGQSFEELLREEELSQSTLHALLDLHDETYPNGVDPDPNEVSIGTRREWKLKYLLVRNVEESVLDEYNLEESIPKALPWITVPVSWASLATRT
jgi:CRISPR-associated protein Csm1